MRGFSILAGAALALVPLAAGANDRDPAATAQPAQTIDPVRLQAAQRTVDLIMQCQAQRGILEFSFAEHEDGMYMFHAHQSEFTELGWVGMFDVRGPEA